MTSSPSWPKVLSVPVPPTALCCVGCAQTLQPYAREIRCAHRGVFVVETPNGERTVIATRTRTDDTIFRDERGEIERVERRTVPDEIPCPECEAKARDAFFLAKCAHRNRGALFSTSTRRWSDAGPLERLADGTMRLTAPIRMRLGTP